MESHYRKHREGARHKEEGWGEEKEKEKCLS